MDFYVMTLFPEMITGTLGTSITGRAMESGAISVQAVDIRDYTEDKHKRVDDYPYGGGAGMVMQAQPVCDCYKAVQEMIRQKKGNQVKSPRVIYLTPQGQTFHQKMAEELAKEEELVFLCGHYEGIDERALEMIVTDYVSIGDYVLTGGEMPAMIMIDAISRLVPGVLNNKESAEFESFQDGLLEYPQYTRPEEYEGRRVPEVLLTGHHANIEKWRRVESIRRTQERRPDLLETAELTAKEYKLVKALEQQGHYRYQEVQEERQIRQAYEIYRGNRKYFKLVSGSSPKPETVQEDRQAVPEGFDPQRKKYGLYLAGDTPVAVLDVLEGFPQEDTYLIGLFMVDVDLQGKGIGQVLYRQVEVQAKRDGYRRMRLGVIEGNDRAYQFWKHMGFEQVKVSEDTERSRNIYVMEKSLEES